jgi:hypothetical protein
MSLFRLKFALPIAGLALLATGAFAQDRAGDAIIKNKLSGAEMVQTARDFLSKMQETKVRVFKLKDAAQKKKDILKVNCVNAKITLVQGHIAVGDNHFQALNAAVSRGDNDAGSYEYQNVNIVYQKVIILGTEAENCIGEDVSYVGATKVDVDIDPSVPTDDPTEPRIPVPIPTRPPEATPFA